MAYPCVSAHRRLSLMNLSLLLNLGPASSSFFNGLLNWREVAVDIWIGLTEICEYIKCCIVRCSISWPPGLGTLRSAVFIGTRIGSGVSWFRWLSVRAIWQGLQEANIHVTLSKTGVSRTSGGAAPHALTLLGGI